MDEPPSESRWAAVQYVPTIGARVRTAVWLPPPRPLPPLVLTIAASLLRSTTLASSVLVLMICAGGSSSGEDAP